MTLDPTRKYRAATEMVHGGVTRTQFGEVSEAIFLTQGFTYESAELAENRFNGEDPGFVYSRYANPTNDIFEKKMCIMEGAEEARAVASGMAAVANAILCYVKAGDHVVASRAMFGSCHYIIDTVLRRFGVDVTIIDGAKIENWEKAITPKTSLIFFETPANPTLEIVDIEAVCKIAHNVGAVVVVDNVFATPLYQKPLALGADVVVYSTTKHIDGQGRCLGGAILSSKEWIADNLHNYFRHTGPGMSPFTAWVMLKGLETMPLRVNQMTKSAGAIADLIAEHPAVSKCFYPGRKDHPQADIIARQMTGGSTMIAFELKGGKKSAFEFCNALTIPLISNNLGDVRSIITHPATTTHQSIGAEARAELGVSDGLLRFSIGLEDSDDLLEDVASALNKAK
ncbi:O-succinylhomoserine sulfhydrylase [Bartonella sp. HY329]|uniref:O-succinylhomoserine sulfhydrylase n=1 Tax=unclassified Bartonella TaxID=2645622 RepID=UPI0021C8C483|nr:MULTISPECIES: O-succinylhomoserine sulfhydrylase [unclassified Bartonella]UXM95032.1 O-succinylhomoserine sulfhydrylase [Bartonella sp. HY329]UXN09355.1 O-succinylhomoserine sulfhydrylase [Bartonella sp. HY328]